MNHPPSSEAPADTGQRLREAFAEVAYDVTPPPVPLAAIERDGRRRRSRRRAAVLSTGCGLLLLPFVMLALRPDGPSDSVEPMSPPAASREAMHSASPSPSPSRSSAPPAGKVHVLEPGKRVTVAGGTKLWLTAEGKHWEDPPVEPGDPGMEEFRSVVDGNLDTGAPGISMQGSGSATGGYTVHGLFYGVRSAAARVEVTAYDGEIIDGTVLRLKGNTSWGVYAAQVKVPEEPARSPDLDDPVRKVTVYDATGEVVAEMDFGV